MVTERLLPRAANKRRLVHQVRKVGAGEARRAARDDRRLDVVAQRHLAHVDLEDLLAAAHVGQRHHDLAVEAARAQQRRVEHVGTVGGGNDDDAFIALEAIHLDQQLIQGLFALIVSAAQARAAMPAHGIDFVDENDAGRVLLGLFEHVAHPRCAHADEHFHEIRAGNGEKRHFGFAGNGSRQQGLAGSGGTDHEHTFRDLAAKFLELAGIFQEVDDFDHFLLGFLDARDVGKGDVHLVLAQQTGAALAEGHGPASARGALHLAHEVGPEANENQYRKGGDQQLQEHRLLLGRFTAEFDALRLQQADQGGVAGLGVVGDEGLARRALLAFDDLALERDRIDIVALHVGEKLRIIDGGRLTGVHAELAENSEQNDGQRNPEQNLFRQIVQVSPTAATHITTLRLKGRSLAWRPSRTYTIPNCRANR